MFNFDIYQVSTKTVNGSLVCLCNHLSSFGGDFLVAPNPIDFDQVWLAMKNIGQSKNFVVLSTICTMFALYFVAVILARRGDKNDELKVRNVILSFTSAKKLGPEKRWLVYNYNSWPVCFVSLLAG